MRVARDHRVEPARLRLEKLLHRRARRVDVLDQRDRRRRGNVVDAMSRDHPPAALGKHRDSDGDETALAGDRSDHPLPPVTSDQVHTREVDLTGMFDEKREALIEVERAKGGSGNGHSIEIRRLDWQRGARRR